MPKPIEESLYILVHNRGYLAPLKMTGPVLRPILVPKTIARNLIMNGCDVYEYVPNSEYTVKLTPTNINDPHRLDGIAISVANTKKPMVKNNEPKITPEIEKLKAVQVPVPDEIRDLNIPKVQPATVIADQPNPEDYIFEYNEDGTVNESVIDWGKFTNKTVRRAIRNRITAINQEAKQKAAQQDLPVAEDQKD